MARRASPENALKEKKKRKVPRLGESGVSGWNLFDGWFEGHEQLGYSDVSIRELQRMLEVDGQAQALYGLITLPIRASRMRIEPAQGGDIEAELISTIFLKPPEQGGMKTPWKSRVLGTLTHAVLTGMEMHEKVYALRNGFIILEKLAHRRRDSFTVKRDKRGDLEKIVQNDPEGGIVDIPKEKLLHYVVNADFNPIFGKSIFLPAYYHYEKKHKLYYISHLGSALNAIPIRVGRMPEEAAEKEKQAFRRALENIGLNTSMTIPEGFTVDFEQGSGFTAPMELINHHDIMMSKAVLGQFIDLGTENVTGSWALSETHFNMFLIGIESLMQGIADLINMSVIPELIDWNYGTGRYPHIILEPAYTDRRILVQQIWERVAGSKNVNFSAEFIVELEEEMSKILGFHDKINYRQIKTNLVDDVRRQKASQSGVERDAIQRERNTIERERVRQDARNAQQSSSQQR